MYILRLILRNALRHKLRTGLTILGITVTVLSFGMLRTVISAWYAGVEASSANRLVTRNSVSLIFPLPIAYKEKIRQVPGVKRVAAGNWFGGIYIEEKNFFPNFVVEPEPYLAMYPEFVMPDGEKTAFLRDRKGCIVGRKTAQRFGWKVGDTVSLRGTIFPGTWDMTVRSIYHGATKGTDETMLLFHWDYLNESLRKTNPARSGQAGFFMIEIDNPALAPEVAGAVDRQFRNSLAETMTETEKAFQLSFISMTEAIVVAIRLVSIVVIFIIMAVMANTMAMTARERIGEYAVLKTLGFGSGFIASLIFGESLVIALTGTGLGMLLTIPAARAFGDALSDFLPIFNVATETFWLDLAAGVTVGCVAALFPAWRATRVRIAEALRRIG